MRLGIGVMLLGLLAAWPSAPRAEALSVFAAASLRNALESVADDYPGALRFSFAGSGTLARQISQGAPADVFISANVDWMDWAQAQGAVVAASRVDLVGNALVVIAPAAGNDTDWKGEGRIAMGLIRAVPAGIYGAQALRHRGLWEALSARIVQTDNVRAALALVALGEAPWGIVYASDAMAEARVRRIETFGDQEHDPIRYPGAIVTGSKSAGGAQAFLDYLTSPPARAIFAAQGFSPLTGEAAQ